MRERILFGALFLVLASTGCTKIGLLVPAPKLVGQVGSPEYKLGEYDVLAVKVWQNEQLSAEVVVRPDGNISLPLIGEIYVLGKTPKEVEQEALERLRRYVQNPTLTIVIKEIKSVAFFILGNIKNPGRYPIYKSLDIVQCVALAGGLTDFADAEHVFIQRRLGGKLVRYQFSYRAYLEGSNVDDDFIIRNGDTIIVP